MKIPIPNSKADIGTGHCSARLARSKSANNGHAAWRSYRRCAPTFRMGHARMPRPLGARTSDGVRP